MRPPHEERDKLLKLFGDNTDPNGVGFSGLFQIFMIAAANAHDQREYAAALLAEYGGSVTDEELQAYCGKVFRPKRKTYELTEADMQEIAKQVHEDFEKALVETREMAARLDARSLERAQREIPNVIERSKSHLKDAQDALITPKKPWWRLWR